MMQIKVTAIVVLIWLCVFEKEAVGKKPKYDPCGDEEPENPLERSSSCFLIIGGLSTKRKVYTDANIMKLGRRYQAKGKYDDALRCYNKAITKNPSELSYYRQRGKCYVLMEDFDRAIHDFREILFKSPEKNKDDQIFLCGLLLRAKRDDEATQEIMNLDGFDLYKLATDLLAHEETEHAVTCCNEAIRRDSKRIEFYKTRAFCLAKLENYESAIKDYVQISSLDSSRGPDYWLDLGTLLLQAGRDDEAKEALENVEDKAKVRQKVQEVERAKKAKREYEETAKRLEIKEGKKPSAGSVEASKKLMREVRRVIECESHKTGEFSVELVEDNLYDWNVCLKRFPPKSALQKDLLKLKRMKGEDAGIVLNITFEDTFPQTPPFVRVVEPMLSSFAIFSGGAFCLEFLTPQGWNPSYTMEAVIIQMASQLVTSFTRIKFGKKNKYNFEKAKKTFDAIANWHKKVGWTPLLRGRG